MGPKGARKPRLQDRVMRSIRRRTGVVVLRSDLSKLGSRSQLTRVLHTLVATGQLVRVGHGIYVKTRMNRFTGTLLPAAPFESIAAEAFRKLGIDVGPGTLARDYNAGRSTQIPMVAVVDTGRRRITRKIQVGGKGIIYERLTEKVSRGHVDQDVVERDIAKTRREKAVKEHMHVLSEPHGVEQLNHDTEEFMCVARRETAAEVVRVRCAYEAFYEVCKAVAYADGTGIVAKGHPDAYAREVVERAARRLQLTPKELRQALTLTNWGLTGVPANPPITADAAVHLVERVLAASLGSRGRG